MVVIGSGATGLASALTAAQGGAKVMVFEKQRSLGGTSNFFEGTFAVESAMQRERYITYTRDEAFRNIMAYSHWRANPRLVRAIVDESADTIEWLQKNGVAFIDATTNRPDGKRTYHTIKGHGAAVVKALSTKAKEKGVEFRPATPVNAILRDAGGIRGVVIEQDGEDVEIAARTVVIGTGGFANNKAWIKKYSGYELDKNVIPVGNVGKMGDGIRMAWEVGAAEEGMGPLELYAAGPVGPEFAMKCELELIAAQPDLWVNTVGERFCDESVGFSDSEMGNAAARDKKGYHYRLFDNSMKAYYMGRGISKGIGLEDAPGRRLTQLDRELQAAFERGSQDVFEADSIGGLAEKIGIDPSTLSQTVEDYNHCCTTGHDAVFAKDPKYLKPLVTPKYYAIKARTVFLGTLGGIRVNHHLEVLDKKDQPISGLYAGGLDAGGMYGDSYCITAATGLCSGFALNSGRIAAKHALAVMKT